VKTSQQWLRGVIQGGAEAPGRVAAAFQCMVVWESRFGPFGLRTVDSARVPKDAPGRSRPENCLKTLYAFAADGAGLRGQRAG
jgi:hypothetical protein